MRWAGMAAVTLVGALLTSAVTDIIERAGIAPVDETVEATVGETGRVGQERSGDTIAWVGDSVSWAEEDAIVAGLTECGFTDIRLDDRPGRTLTTVKNIYGKIPSGYAAITRLESTVDPDVWVLQLGLNDIHMGHLATDAESDQAIDDVVRRVDPDDRIVWVNTWSAVSDFGEAHARFGRVLARRPDIRVVDWASIAPGLPHVVADGIHGSHDDIALMADMACGQVGAR